MHQVKSPAPIRCFLTNRVLSFRVVLARAVFLVFSLILILALVLIHQNKV